VPPLRQADPLLGAAPCAASDLRLDLTALSFSSWRSASWPLPTRSSARRRASGTPQTVAATMADPELSTQIVCKAPTAPIAALESIFRRKRHCICYHRRRRCRRRRRRRRRRRQHSLPDQRSLAGTSNAKAAGVTPPHGTMRKSSSRAANRRRSHHQTARHQGGWAALRCPGQPVPNLQQAFELRSCHLRAPCPPSRDACASPSLW